MSARASGRKRARKACVPCHQRKRKCNSEFPCGTCTTYEYRCSYSDDDNEDVASIATSTVASTAASIATNTTHVQLPVKRVRLDSEKGATSRPTATSRSVGVPSPAASGPREGDGLSSSIRSPSTATPPGVFDAHKAKYAGASAVMAFPHILGGLLGSNSAPKLHSLAYSFGRRPEAAAATSASAPPVALGTLISEEDLRYYSDVYFASGAPICDVLDQRVYSQRCSNYYRDSSSSSSSFSGNVVFGAIAAGVAAFGSFLSPVGHPQEEVLVRYSKAILDNPASVRVLGIDHIVAWALHVSYLRATSLPDNVWMASCTMMHLCEMLGLHEEENIQKLVSANPDLDLDLDQDRLRRIFWVTWAGHHIMAYEYDLSAVAFRSVTCQAIRPANGSVADQFVQMAQIIPAPNSPFRLREGESLSLREELCGRLRALAQLPFTDPFLVVTKADLAFCFYRRLHQLGISDANNSDNKNILQLVVDAGNAAGVAALQLVGQGRLFWNIIGSAFQYICVLLAMDTPVASAHIATAFACLERLTMAVDTRLTREALSMARHLLSLSMAKKRRELAVLEAVEATYQPVVVQMPADLDADINADTNAAAAAEPEVDWDLLNWEQFLIEPYRSMFES
ncbi:zn 2cys6 transcription factor [Limtongia smithiae]|uniref:zn 2cys6 transcription factor n=1 Tax=Limtongia smithiae TaxID=1125753 RepID=UPI0034CFFA33